ncbi:MAG: DNA alkylation repair protein [Clostridia bacterium]|nr:DNA alkylation repair protein [Clostridia bacterium]MBQ4543556.1 DNA alkylation repair protein [Clostridia bacterium]
MIRELFELQDLKYRDFHSKLMPTIDKDTVIGVRVPALRKLAKEVFNNGGYGEFLKALPHRYYEENNLHAFLIEQITDFNLCIEETEKFLPFIDNWATCDMFRPKIFKNHKTELLKRIKVWIKSKETYTVRFAIGMLMVHYSDNDFKKEYAELVAGVKSDGYYVNMMIAWYFATLLWKQYDIILPYIENNVLPLWVHNKTIQKATESYRITKEQKEYLKKHSR